MQASIWKGKKKNTHIRIHHISLLVDRVLSCPEPDALDDGQHGRGFPRRRPAVVLARLDQLGLDGEDGLLDARRLDEGGVGHVQARQVELGNAVGGVDRGRVGGFDEVLGDDVDDACVICISTWGWKGGGGGGKGEVRDEFQLLRTIDKRDPFHDGL